MSRTIRKKVTQGQG